MAKPTQDQLNRALENARYWEERCQSLEMDIRAYFTHKKELQQLARNLQERVR
jgi:hypothetical protein